MGLPLQLGLSTSCENVLIYFKYTGHILSPLLYMHNAHISMYRVRLGEE